MFGYDAAFDEFSFDEVKFERYLDFFHFFGLFDV